MVVEELKYPIKSLKKKLKKSDNKLHWGLFDPNAIQHQTYYGKYMLYFFPYCFKLQSKRNLMSLPLQRNDSHPFAVHFLVESLISKLDLLFCCAIWQTCHCQWSNNDIHSGNTVDNTFFYFSVENCFVLLLSYWIVNRVAEFEALKKWNRNICLCTIRTINIIITIRSILYIVFLILLNSTHIYKLWVLFKFFLELHYFARKKTEFHALLSLTDNYGNICH